MLQLLMATPRSRNLFALGTAVAALVIFGVVIRLVFTSVGASVPPEGRVAVLESRLRELEGEVARLRRQVGDFTSDATPVRASAKKTLLPTAPVSTTGLASVGSASATVAVIEYTDFQCPYCRQYFIETWPELYRQHISTGQIRYLFSHLPIASIHSQARAAAEAAECGHRQGKFWELRSLLFQNPKALTRDDLTRHAKKVSLNIPLFESCLAKEGPKIGRAHV